MAKKITTKNGKEITLLNPSEKGKKFAEELRLGVRLKNNMDSKFDANGNLIPLSEKGKAYRSGFLASRKDSAGIYKWKKKKGYN